MKREAARMRKWLLGAAPLMLAGSRLFPAGGAEAALFLWAAAGLLIPDRRRYPYVRKPRLGIARLFFACSAGVFLLEGTRMILARLLTLSPGSPDALPADASRVYYEIKPGEYLSVEEYLYCAMLESDCICCNLLAEYVAGCAGAFADMMNERAEELGCVNTHFGNACGLPDEGHTTCAYDLALMTRAAMESQMVVTSAPAVLSSHAVSRAPCSSGRVSSEKTLTRTPFFIAV